jgi:hypothetical protein
LADHADLGPEDLLAQVIDPEIEKFSAFFAPATGGPLSRFERELLRSFRYWQLRGPPTP